MFIKELVKIGISDMIAHGMQRWANKIMQHLAALFTLSLIYSLIYLFMFENKQNAV